MDDAPCILRSPGGNSRANVGIAHTATIRSSIGVEASDGAPLVTPSIITGVANHIVAVGVGELVLERNLVFLSRDKIMRIHILGGAIPLVVPIVSSQGRCRLAIETNVLHQLEGGIAISSHPVHCGIVVLEVAIHNNRLTLGTSADETNGLQRLEGNIVDEDS